MNREEKIARLFHNTYERLAPSFGYETREDTKEFDAESKNGKLMIAVCNKVQECFDKGVYIPLDIISRMKVGDEVGFGNESIGGRKHFNVVRDN